MDKLKSDILLLMKLSYELGKYEGQFLTHINTTDKFNFDLEKSETIRVKMIELQKEIEQLTTKWF